MRLSNIANVFDVEHDNGRLIEIGLTTVALKERKLVQTYSIALKPNFEISAEISQLTGWTNAKLLKRGVSKDEASRLLDKHGSTSRLLVTDHSDEIPFLEQAIGRPLSPHRLNISILLALQTGNDINLGLEQMLSLCDMQFEGHAHSAADDSRNIARLFLQLLPDLTVASSQRQKQFDELAAQPANYENSE